jgi:plastocyanin domain-containing protein
MKGNTMTTMESINRMESMGNMVIGNMTNTMGSMDPEMVTVRNIHPSGLVPKRRRTSSCLSPITIQFERESYVDYVA